MEYSVVTSVGQRKKPEGLIRLSHGYGFDSRRGFRFFLCYTLVTTEYSIFLISFRA